MNFELKTLGLDRAALEKYDAMVLLVGEDFKPAQDAVSSLVAQAIKAGDFETKVGQLLSCYRPSDLGSVRLVMVGTGDGSAKSVRQAVLAAVAALKTGPAAKTLLLQFSTTPKPGSVRSGLTSIADASYAYTTTKSKPQPRKLQRVTIAAPDAARAKSEFERARCVVLGVELAKE